MSANGGGRRESNPCAVAEEALQTLLQLLDGVDAAQDAAAGEFASDLRALQRHEPAPLGYFGWIAGVGSPASTSAACNGGSNSNSGALLSSFSSSSSPPPPVSDEPPIFSSPSFSSSFSCAPAPSDLGPIVEISVVHSGDPLPEGHVRISKTTSGRKADLNAGAGGTYVYLSVKRDPSWEEAPPIVGIAIIFPDRGESVPPSFSVVRRRGVPADLNANTSGEKMYLCVRHVTPGSGNPLTDLVVFMPRRGEKMPQGYCPVQGCRRTSSVQIAYCMRLLSMARLVRQLPVWATETGKREDVEGEAEADENGDRGTEDGRACDKTVLLLTGLYVRTGATSQMVLRVLTQLMGGRSGFFLNTHLLDCTIEAVCDQLDQARRELLPALRTFLASVVRATGARLKPKSLLRVFEGYIALASFDGEGEEKCGQEEGGPVLSSMCELLLLLLGRAEEEEAKDVRPPPAPTAAAATSPPSTFVSEIVSELADEVVDAVELSQVMDRAEETMRRHVSSSIGLAGSDFWRELSAARGELRELYRPGAANVLLILCAVCKVAREGLWLFSRDVSRKCLALRVLHFMVQAGPASYTTSGADSVYDYQMRRLVVAVVLENCAVSLKDENIFKLVLKLVDTLWRRYRQHCKVEMAVIMEQFLFRVLRGSAPLPMRILILETLSKWFEVPHNLVELYLNYDVDRKFLQQWKIYEDMVTTICSLAEEIFTADRLLLEEDLLRHLRFRALTSTVQLIKGLMDASGHGHLIVRDPRTREISLGALGGWEADEEHDELELSADRGTEVGGMEATAEAANGEVGGEGLDARARRLLDVSQSSSATSPPKAAMRSPPPSRSRPSSFRHRRELRRRAEAMMQQALELNRKGGLKKCVQYLIASGFIADSPRDITNFLRIYQEELDPAGIGEFLSEPDAKGSDYWRLIRLQYVRAMSFHGMTLEDALRHFLTNGGFRLPGEGQKIDRILQAFGECFFEDNEDHCPFRSAETPFVLSYAIIMLNTDLHRANSGTDRKRRKRMTRDDFIKNVTGGVGSAAQLTPVYLASLYDSIEARPIQMLLSPRQQSMELSAQAEDPAALLCSELGRGASQGIELLRALSTYQHRFLLMGVDTNLSLELVKQMFCGSWFHFHGLVGSMLERMRSGLRPEAETITACLGIVQYALSAAIFLGTETERQAFADQLAKLIRVVQGPDATPTSERWHALVLLATPAQAEAAIAVVHERVSQHCPMLWVH
jgi:hypothetical protein